MKTTAIADSIGIELSKPRTVGRMTNRANGAAFAEDSVPSYYRINDVFPFVDHCLSELNERFPEQTRLSFLAFQLLPSRVQNIYAEHVHVEDIHTRYEDDLPDSIGFIAEMERWKMFCAGLQKQDSNQSLEEAIELADPNYYPNLHAVIRVLLTMPVRSVPCERSFSAMRRLKHWSRSTMTEVRLAGLASLLFIHRDIYLCRENIMRKFDEAKKRRLGPLHF
jgi:hypothetical protein